MLLACAVVGGIGNGVFHPVDYTLFNRKVAPTRLGHAYSVHGITGSLGWALAPAFVVPLAIAFSWRVALASAGVLAFGGAGWCCGSTARRWRSTSRRCTRRPGRARAAHGAGAFDFLRIPAVWMCFGFFFFYAVIAQRGADLRARGGRRQLHAVPVALVAICLTVYMVASAAGMVVGGFLAADPSRCERIVGVGFGIAALLALVLALADLPPALVPVLFGAMGFASGIAGPSRDLLVKRSTPAQRHRPGLRRGLCRAGHRPGGGAAGLRPADGPRPVHQRASLGLALMQAVLIASAFNVRRVRREALTPVSA